MRLHQPKLLLYELYRRSMYQISYYHQYFQARRACVSPRTGQASPTLSLAWLPPSGLTGTVRLEYRSGEKKLMLQPVGGANPLEFNLIEIESWRCSPVVVITPETGSLGNGLGGFQEMNQLPTFSEITKYQAHVCSPKRWCGHKMLFNLYIRLQDGRVHQPMLQLCTNGAGSGATEHP